MKKEENENINVEAPIEQKVNTGHVDWDGGIDWNSISAKSFGGTELMCRRIETSMPKDLLKNFQIIPSRVRELDETKIRILILNDLPHDPESQHLKDGGWRKFHKLVFVSYWQREWYVREFQVPFSRTVVLQNAIIPIEVAAKPDPKKQINLIYHTTPHRGLDILYSVVEKLVEKYPTIHLDVYSSFGIYGWKERDEQFKDLFQKITDHKSMTYHGYKPNDEVRTALQKAHIFSYPNTWMETSCLSLMEAMSAKCLCVHSDFGALPETAANWTMMYPFNEDRSVHANVFYNCLSVAIDNILTNDTGQTLKLNGIKDYADLFYNWNIRKIQWENFLKSMLNVPREIETPHETFVYRA